MAVPQFTTPGVQIQELNAFPNSVVPVATAIPAFIGYTARADYKGKSYANVAVEITSLQEFLLYFGNLDPSDPSGNTPLPDNQQYKPMYCVTPVGKNATQPADIVGPTGQGYYVQPDPTTVYYLYNSIKLFYLNGGGTCYVVSVGEWNTTPTFKPFAPTTATPNLVNTYVSAADLQVGLNAIAQESDPTMIVIPDAVLLTPGDNAKINGLVLQQCSTLMSRVGIFDLPGADDPDPTQFMNQVILPFRNAIGLNGLNYGIAYYPFLMTSVMDPGDIDFNNFGGSSKLGPILGNAPAVTALLGQMSTATYGAPPPGATTPSVTQVENALRNTLQFYQQLHDFVLNDRANVLPPSGAMAGAYTMVDDQKGVWHAPANISLVAVTDTTQKMTDALQGPLNVDAATGKSINVIRTFPGKGVVVWGARTLDGNSQDWRYVNVRRTLIMVEQSLKLAAFSYVFEPNDENTWSLVSSMLSNFLTNLWAEGALVGPTPGSAFSVAVGLGVTMTPDDILNGIMRVAVKVAVSHPAEFILITIEQQQQQAG